VFQAKPDIGIRGKVEHHLTIPKGVNKRLQIKQITCHQLKIGILQRNFNKAPLARGEIVESDNMVSLCKKAINQIASNETTCPGNHAFHCDNIS